MKKIEEKHVTDEIKLNFFQSYSTLSVCMCVFLETHLCKHLVLIYSLIQSLSQ
jgi:hypothetical protein